MESSGRHGAEPITPPARLEVIANRLDTMLEAVCRAEAARTDTEKEAAEEELPEAGWFGGVAGEVGDAAGIFVDAPGLVARRSGAEVFDLQQRGIIAQATAKVFDRVVSGISIPVV